MDELDTLFQTRKPPRKEGLSPLSLLTMPAPGQVQVLSWLMRRPTGATLLEIQEAMQGQKFDIPKVLHDLREEGRIQAAVLEGEVYYRVQIRTRNKARTPSEQINQMWSRLDQDKVRFVRSLPLFADLTAEEIADVAELMELREYNRHDVILWEGQVSDKLYLVKSGVVAISLFTADMQQAQRLAYLQAGDVLGEYNLITPEDQAATATATAASRVELLMITHKSFRELMAYHPSILLELSRLLVKRLIGMNPKRGQGARHLCLVLGMEGSQGRTALGLALAEMFAADQKTVYGEYPSIYSLLQVLGMTDTPDRPIYAHPNGFPLANWQAGEQNHLPTTLRVTLWLEKLLAEYATVVLGMSAFFNDSLAYLLGQAEQVLLVATPETWEQAVRFTAEIRPHLHPERATVHLILNRAKPAQADWPKPPAAEFAIPYLPELDLANPTASAPLRELASTLANRRGRTNQISVFIPTTVAVNTPIDTQPYVQQALTLLGERFGGATSSQAQGVWNSEEVGLVGETVYIVRSYATKNALARHLDEVLAFVERMKSELSQEAMAVEVNQRLMFI
ncbi:MAG: cyclic nucleotide-binding domain-containing protein [Chloroflexi bacterium]|nr:cyclic nucleotide-binding domain-containing protein [Chloroflexota bacterium]